MNNISLRSAKNKKRLCLAYAAGPGDIVKTFSYWQKGEDDPNQVSVTYSSLFYETCRSLDARGVALSSCSRIDSIRTEQFLVENMPKEKPGHGLLHHLQQIMYIRKIIQKAISEGANVLIVADSTGYFFPIAWFAPSYLKIIPTLHCNLFSRFNPLSPFQKIINKLNSHLFSKKVAAILTVSPSINAQIESITNNKSRPIYRFHQLYRKEYFDAVKSPDFSSDHFNLLFVGRLEKEKGVFDLLQIAETLDNQGINHIIIHICGNGSCENELRLAVAEKKLDKKFYIHGYCNQKEMITHINASHAFIVPTRTTFEEGYNKVVIEALLSKRPVITSPVCVYPEIETISDAVIVVPPDDIEGYLAAVIRLATDKQYYRDKQSQSSENSDKFYNKALSWQANLERIIRDIEQ